MKKIYMSEQNYIELNFFGYIMAKNTITKNYLRKEKKLFAESTHSNWEMKQTRTGYTK